jgi:hypothetical protein
LWRLIPDWKVLLAIWTGLKILHECRKSVFNQDVSTMKKCRTCDYNIGPYWIMVMPDDVMASFMHSDHHCVGPRVWYSKWPYDSFIHGSLEKSICLWISVFLHLYIFLKYCHTEFQTPTLCGISITSTS